MAQSTFALPRFSLKGSQIAETCPAAPAACDPSARYRMLDGSCNNAQRTAWGKSNSALQRLLPPQYGDGLGTPRASGLPSARAVSTAVTSSQVGYTKICVPLILLGDPQKGTYGRTNVLNISKSSI